MKEDVAFKAWLAEVEGKLPDELKESFQKITAHEVSKDIFRGGIRREDYNRRVNEVEERRAELEGWYEKESPKNRQLVEQNTKLNTQLAALKAAGLLDPEESQPRARHDASLDEIREELKKEMDEKVKVLDVAIPRLLGEFGSIIHRTAKEGYSIDPRDVLNYAAQNKIDVNSAFDSLTQAEREKRAAEAQKKNEEKWKEAGRREALSSLSTPDRMRPAGPTILDTLQDKNVATDRSARVAAAVKDFMEDSSSNAASHGLV